MSKGFFMLEFLVYLCLFSCISIFLMHFVVNSSLYLRTQRVELQRTLNFLTAIDLIAHEIGNTNAEKSQWYKTDKNCVVWHSLSRQKDIGLSVIDKKLVRIIGHYVPHNNAWDSKVTNVITDNVLDLILDYQWDSGDHEQLNLITCSLTGFLTGQKKYTTSRSIALHNRYLS